MISPRRGRLSRNLCIFTADIRESDGTQSISGGWKPGRLGELYRSSNSMVVLTVLFPMWIGLSLTGLNGDAGIKDTVMEASILISMLIVYFSILMHPVRPAKMYYLCPMTQQERTAHIRRTYLFRVAVHMVIFLCGLAVLLCVGRFRAGAVLLLLLNDLLFSMLTGPEKQDETGMVYLIVLLSCSFVLNLIQLVGLSDDASHMVAQIASFVLFFLLELPLFVGYSKHIRRQLKSAERYER